MKLKYIGSARSPCSLYVVKRVRRSGGDGRGENKEAKEKFFFGGKAIKKSKLASSRQRHPDMQKTTKSAKDEKRYKEYAVIHKKYTDKLPKYTISSFFPLSPPLIPHPPVSTSSYF